jgi:hypothetical protein
LQRGDLVFWPGHVAIARGRDSIVHANAFHMSVVVEPAGEAFERIRGMESEIASVRRMPVPSPILTGDIDVTKGLM